MTLDIFKKIAEGKRWRVEEEDCGYFQVNYLTDRGLRSVYTLPYINDFRLVIAAIEHDKQKNRLLAWVKELPSTYETHFYAQIGEGWQNIYSVRKSFNKKAWKANFGGGVIFSSNNLEKAMAYCEKHYRGRL